MTIAERLPSVCEPPTSIEAAPAPLLPATGSVRSDWLVSGKIQPVHRAKLAMVYVRQSSTHQVLHHRESRERQYALPQRAEALGWPRERVEIVDDDQGHSATTAENRSGFHRLMAEVAMEHVGLVLGLEMSRLARSNKDWHQLLELCAVFGTILADEDGVYDPRDPNDRLLLGMKGTLSEFELVTMRNRLDRGRMNKAHRGELFLGVPSGYVIGPNGRVALDPDEQAQSVVRLIFEKFAEIGSLYGMFRDLIRRNIRLPVRSRSGANKGELEWRRASIYSLWQMLHHPIYAGAYAYGRRSSDPKRKASGSSRCHRQWRERDEWKVLLKGCLPAYITWEQYLKNEERLKQNRSHPKSCGTPRRGRSLLPGLLICGRCGRRMNVHYHGGSCVMYVCQHHYLQATPNVCSGLSAQPVEELVAQQVLRALEPASVELSLQAQADLEQERERLHQHWRQTLQRAHYDCGLAARRYHAVDPANRLVAATLEQSWEAALRKERQLQDDYDRFQRGTPSRLSPDERQGILEAAEDIGALWRMSSTTNLDRQAVVRCLVDRVVVHVSADSEHFDATIHWAGGYTSQHALVRPVASYAQLRDFEALVQHVVALRQQGCTTGDIAKQLNAEGFHPPKRRDGFNSSIVRELLSRRGLTGHERSDGQLLGEHEWWPADLARKVRTTSGKLADWARRGWINSRRTPIQRQWILWADNDEIARIRQLVAASQRGVTQHSATLTTPKPRAEET